MTANQDAPSQAGGLANRSLHGALFVISSSLGVKTINLGAQLVLAWILVPNDFGLISLAFAVTSLTGILTANGLQQVLVQKSKAFDANAGQGLWLSIAMNTGAALISLALAPLAATIYNKPELIPLIAGLVSVWPLAGLTSVYAAKVRKDLRFKVVSICDLGQGIIQHGGTVLCALSGLGVWSFILPLIPKTLFGWIISRYAAGPLPIEKPSFRKWPQLLKPTLWLTLTFGLTTLSTQGTFLILGAFFSTSDVGLFFWAVSIASQVIFVIASNLATVLFPTLTHLRDEPDRLRTALASTARLMLISCSFIAVLQAATCEPIIKLMFKPIWHPTISLIYWLSLSIPLHGLYTLSSSFLLADCQNRTNTLASAAKAFLILTGTLLGCLTGDLLSLALCTSLALLLSYLMWTQISLRHQRSLLAQLNNDILRTGLTFALSMYATYQLSAVLTTTHPVGNLIVFGLIAVVTFTISASLFQRRALRECLARARDYLRFLSKRTPNAA